VNHNTTPRAYVDVHLGNNNVSDLDFWVCTWNRADMQDLAFELHLDRVWSSSSPALRTAFMVAQTQIKVELNASTTQLARMGGLLFAHAATTRPARIQIGGAA
jgi:hypothetical protein